MFLCEMGAKHGRGDYRTSEERFFESAERDLGRGDETASGETVRLAGEIGLSPGALALAKRTRTMRGLAQKTGITEEQLRLLRKHWGID